jgi:PAS domain-containing protein
MRLKLRKMPTAIARIAIVFTHAKVSGNPIIFANDSFLKLTDYEREEVLSELNRVNHHAGLDREYPIYMISFHERNPNTPKKQLFKDMSRRGSAATRTLGSCNHPCTQGKAA